MISITHITAAARRSYPARRWVAATAGTLLALSLVPPAAAHRMVSGVTAQLETANVKVREGEYAIFNLALSRSFDFNIRYTYRTQDGTAQAGADYTATTGYVEFPAGQRWAQVRVKTHSDAVIDNEHFQLVLSDMQTHGYGKVWGAYIWTDWWRIEGLPVTKTLRARIRNVAPVGNWKGLPKSS